MKEEEIYTVRILKKALKNLNKMPSEIQEKFKLLLKDLKNKGAVQPNWKNYSKLDGDKYHCHLSYSWVACRTWKKGTLLVEVYYAGSREKVPY